MLMNNRILQMWLIARSNLVIVNIILWKGVLFKLWFGAVELV